MNRYADESMLPGPRPEHKLEDMLHDEFKATHCVPKQYLWDVQLNDDDLALENSFSKGFHDLYESPKPESRKGHSKVHLSSKPDINKEPLFVRFVYCNKLSKNGTLI